MCAQPARSAYKIVGHRGLAASSTEHLCITTLVPERVQSIDIFRGLTVAAMILVNDPGDPQEIYAPLRHADWNGYTFADLIFPNFLFLAGASLVFSLDGRVKRGDSRLELARGLGKRTVNLLLLKLVIAELPTFRLRRIRIFGVLFRTALCTLLGGVVLLRTLRVATLMKVIAGLLAAYYLLLRIPFGTVNQPLLDSDNNLTAWLDRHIAHLLHGELHTGALYNVTHDPEGLLSSLPALATVLMGACAALVLRGEQGPSEKAYTLATAGVASLALGTALDGVMPVNKNLWTSSYALVSGGWSLLGLAAIYWVFDVKKRKAPAIAVPAKIFGANALVAYALSTAVNKSLRLWHVRQGEHSVSVRTLAYRATFGRKKSSPARSLAFAVSYAAVMLLPNVWLWRRKIMVKI